MLSRYRSSFFASLPITLAYGLTTRFVFQSDLSSELLGTLTLGLILFGPFAVGALTVFFAPQKEKTSWMFAIFMPWGACLILLMTILLLAWEAWICILMATPFLLVMSSVGGALVCLIFRRRSPADSSNTYLLAVVLLSPYIVAPLEHQFPVSDSIRTVENQIVINADAATVWRNITSVSQIKAAEHHPSFYHIAGLPRPIEAMLSHEGVGGVRRATYEEGLRFSETVTVWEAERKLSFTIDPDTSAVHTSRLPLKEIGGKSFTTLEGTYTIEPLSAGQVILHFSSKHRLSTRFNSYGGLWTDFIMSDLQSNILGIIKARAEAGH
jgi:Polyketide cyclase / dehydrase and lipid transport